MPVLNLATSLTLVRIAAIPLIVLVFYLPPGEIMRPLSCIIFTIAGITDALDGYVARKYNQQSPFGAFLDPVADKLMVAATLVIVVQADPRPVMALVAAIIIGREIAISALREWMAEIGARKVVAVSGFGKLKTIMQMVGLGCMLWWYPLFDVIHPQRIGFWLLLIAAGLTLWSMVAYLRAAWPELSRSDRVS
jgi:CDP-diacylglycerol--glycerol-3-phosphate 3-phosphatidyltransferase